MTRKLTFEKVTGAVEILQDFVVQHPKLISLLVEVHKGGLGITYAADRARCTAFEEDALLELAKLYGELPGGARGACECGGACEK